MQQKKEKKDKLKEYIESQKRVREEFEIMEKNMIEDRINKLVKEGGIKSNLFWKIRKQILNQSKLEEEYDTITEEGVTLTKPEEAKEYIANFYENLYQAREGCDEYKIWTEKIINTVKEIDKNIPNLPEEEEFTDLELFTAIKKP